MDYEATYCVGKASIVASIWILTTLVCVTAGIFPQDALLMAYVGYTRISTTFFNSCMVPFLTNVVRDHKCVEWTNMSYSIWLTGLYKLFNGMHDIVNVLLITTLDWRVYVILVLSDILVSCMSTVRYIQSKRCALSIVSLGQKETTFNS